MKRIEKEANEISLKAFRTMGLRDYCRVDMRLSDDNKLYVLEVNPDLTPDTRLIRIAGVEGYTYKTALRKIVELAIERGKCEGQL